MSMQRHLQGWIHVTLMLTADMIEKEMLMNI